jgi:hypothetical protein
VLSQLPWNTWHIRWGPCKYVSVVPEETGEREFLFLPEVVADDHRLGWVGKAEADLLRPGVASKAVSVRFCFGVVRSVGATFLASATMTAETSKLAFVVAISRASLSHLNEMSRSP